MTTQPKDLIMWVGSKPYPTWQAFANEARAMGVCKRVRIVPRDIQIGVSRCFLLHGERVKALVESTVHSYCESSGLCHYCDIDRTANSQNPTPCTVHKIKRTGKPRRFIMGYFVIEEILKATVDDMTEKTDRLCGSLVPGGSYLKGPLTELPEPKPWPGNTFVGFRYYTEAT